MSGLWRLAWRNLRRRPRRSLATLASIGMGVGCAVIVFGYIMRLDRFLAVASIYLLHIGHLVVHQADGSPLFSNGVDDHLLDSEARKTIDRLLGDDPNVAAFGGILKVKGLAGNGCATYPAWMIGVEPSLERFIRSRPSLAENAAELASLDAGRDLFAWPELETGVMVARGLADLLKKSAVYRGEGSMPKPAFFVDCLGDEWKAKSAADPFIQLMAMDFSAALAVGEGIMVGRMRTGFTEYEDGLLIGHLSNMQRMFGTTKVSAVAVFLRDTGHIEEKARDLEARLRSKGLHVRVSSWTAKALSPVWEGLHQFLWILGTLISLILAVIIGLSVANTAVINVLERTREFGMFRALGFRVGRLLSVVMGESLILAVGGAILGLSGAFAFQWILELVDVRYSPPGVAVDVKLLISPSLELCLIVVAGVILLSVGVTWFAVRRILARRIVELLSGNHF